VTAAEGGGGVIGSGIREGEFSDLFGAIDGWTAAVGLAGVVGTVRNGRCITTNSVRPVKRMAQPQSRTLNKENLGDPAEAFFPLRFLGGMMIRETRGGECRPGQGSLVGELHEARQGFDHA